MRTLAGAKIRRYREQQEPRLSIADLGARLGVPFSTVQGWEERGKVPRDPATLRRLALMTVCSADDWFQPAQCPACTLPGDDPRIEQCRIAGCPLAAQQVA